MAQLPDGGFALSGIRVLSRWNRPGWISGYAHPALSPDGGFALSGLQNRAHSDTFIAFTSGLAAAVLTPAEIGEPERE
ncbi:hypothetical protein [Kosakonia cowanii]|uniref:hypothetical protein n=1 Tax=Kosakonia cowanii TaxID=208223 RepID=UPI0025A9A9C0|nr:hypothetical protein [Kosakonia cowanii]MDM9618185.1 hypothetical protein [Kosakonia cowanii]MDP4563272.1 hypothetical protein [Kosakonia cowanii]